MDVHAEENGFENGWKISKKKKKKKTYSVVVVGTVQSQHRDISQRLKHSVEQRWGGRAGNARGNGTNVNKGKSRESSQLHRRHMVTIIVQNIFTRAVQRITRYYTYIFVDTYTNK